MTTLPTTAQRYLDALDAALDGVPDAAKQAILDDVRAHVSDAAEEGRDIDATLAALGSPRRSPAMPGSSWGCRRHPIPPTGPHDSCAGAPWCSP
ncbi:HAAS signaling domain-containing protein [Microbacterium sp. NIBRBAC000506063]|uniref:HAAS signaling domain-containing protein n=1 Tax=Microbacterium sp. NIBRBAC000506063 TaxID=2734618 RepID=UPI001BB5BD0A|nr:hypothetical protein [Microbacterium sp. NIBRBAC000506063]QTV79012.1 hypothetical protein KAE78_07515 [Microbacterium sp. NIBRBAC000506063]